MTVTISKVHIFTKTGHSTARDLARDIAAWLGERDIAAEVAEHHRGGPPKALMDTARPDLLLVLGGDGTLLSVARQVLNAGVDDLPVLGVNLGNLGFLARAPVSGWQEFLSETLNGEMCVEQRMALACTVLRGDVEVHKGLAINDFVVSRGVMARLIRLRTLFDDRPVCALRADGLIVCTPTGSTAYSVSAGGPVMHPRTSGIGVVAVCPFLQPTPSMVLPAEGELEVRIEEESGEVYLNEDGQNIFQLLPGDRVCIRRARRVLCLVTGNGGETYFQVLREKGFTSW